MGNHNKSTIVLSIIAGILGVAVLIMLCIILFAPNKQEHTNSTETSVGTLNTEPSQNPTENSASVGTEATSPTETIPTSPTTPEDVQTITLGIDVSKFQGMIDWQEVAKSGIQFAMIRIGYRTTVGGQITEDACAAYNIQEALKSGIQVGVYFFSCAISHEEISDEFNWVLDYISDYDITYPVAYNCERFHDPENRHSHLTKTERTDLALSFLQGIEDAGYHAMFYAAAQDMEEDSQWEISRIDSTYRVWAADYTDTLSPETDTSGYTRPHAMWQYSCTGSVAGISGNVDLDVSYFCYPKSENPNNAPDTNMQINWDALYAFEKTDESVTAKEKTNLRDIPSQGEDSTVLYTLTNGEIATRIGISSYGWSKLLYNGNTYYAVSSLLTTDLTPPESSGPDIKTQFTTVNELVTAKEAVNLRTLPSVTHEESKIVVQVTHGTVFTRTGINTDVGWSRVEYNGQTLYCVSQYIMPAEEPDNPETTKETGSTAN